MDTDARHLQKIGGGWMNGHAAKHAGKMPALPDRGIEREFDHSKNQSGLTPAAAIILRESKNKAKGGRRKAKIAG